MQWPIPLRKRFHVSCALPRDCHWRNPAGPRVLLLDHLSASLGAPNNDGVRAVSVAVRTQPPRPERTSEMTERPNCDRRWRIQAATDEGLLPQDAREANGWAEYAEDGCMVKNIRINRQPNACFSRPIDLKFERALLGIVRGRKAAPSVSIYQGIDDVSVAGLARVLLGSHEGANSSIESPSEINYLAGRLVAGERWRYAPPAGHAVLRTAVCKGAVRAPDRIEQGELAIFAPSEAAVEFLAEVDTEFMRVRRCRIRTISCWATIQSTLAQMRWQGASTTSAKSARSLSGRPGLGVYNLGAALPSESTR